MKTLPTIAFALLAGSQGVLAAPPTNDGAQDWVDKLALVTAREYYMHGKLDEAEQQLRALAKNTPLSADGLVLASDILRERGDWAGAETALRAAIAAAPGRADLHLRLGQALQQQNQLDAADVEFARYVELNRGSQP
jgi:predicted Zn-dependent protease